jgi:hypothetical protein
MKLVQHPVRDWGENNPHDADKIKPLNNTYEANIFAAVIVS